MTAGAVSDVPPAEGAPRPSTVHEVREAVRAAAAATVALRIVGGGSWLDAGRPVRGDARPLHVGGLAGIVEYTPGDLVLTARAGTTLDEIDRVTAAEKQWLTLDPFGSERGTIGATAATASAGPLAHAFGAPRDVVLGVEVVTGTGAVVRGGGRVVKNVAGFDLTRLMIGAWGTLGVLTEISVRLRARPEHDVTVALAAAAEPHALAPLLARLRAAPLAPLAMELLDAALAARLGVALEGGTGPRSGGGAVLLTRLAGNEELVRAQHEIVRASGETREATPAVWRALRACEPAGAAVLRLSSAPGRFAETWGAATRIARQHAGSLVHGSPGRGVARVILPPAGDPAAIGGALGGNAQRGTVRFERLPPALWADLTAPATADPLSRRVHEAFDPQNVLNPGILGA